MLCEKSDERMPSGRRKILNVAMNDSVLKSRSAILESAGYEVIPAITILEVEAACERQRTFDLVILGYALPKGEKRRVMASVRKSCGRLVLRFRDLSFPEKRKADTVSACLFSV